MTGTPLDDIYGQRVRLITTVLTGFGSRMQTIFFPLPHQWSIRDPAIIYIYLS
jgi:hypothetical protein